MTRLAPMMALRHASVGAVVAATAAAGLFGVVGEDLPERFDQKQITVSPAGGEAVRVREVVDQDFGNARDRHGYQRIIPNDFGAPVDVVASSPDAPDQLSVRPSYGETTIRIGDANQNVTGQRRYELAYTYPEARLSTGRLGLDVIGTTDEETLRLEILVTGFELTNLVCSVGDLGDSGGCEFEEVDTGYRAEIAPLAAGRGVTIGADIVSVGEPNEIPIPALPDRRSGSNRAPLAGAMAGAGAVTGALVYRRARRRGSNEVAGVGAADAAFGAGPGDITLRAGDPLPPPVARTGIQTPTGPVRLVADEDMDELATTEFVPPAGIEPWQGAVALLERIDNNTVGAWFSGLAARGVLTIERVDDKVVLRPGPDYANAGALDAGPVAHLFGGQSQIVLGKYSKSFAAAWTEVRTMQDRWIHDSGWWKRLAPRAGLGVSLMPFLLIGFAFLMVGGTALGSIVGLFRNPIVAVLAGVAVVAATAGGAYATLLPARSTTGSAVALRTESFRRFLAASEGRHVEWAWKHGLLREYSAWAVALGTADTWQRALSNSQVPPAEYVSGPLLVYSMSPSFGSSYTPPSSSGGSGFGGGGGFSGGSVGGGGGGGSSGSW